MVRKRRTDLSGTGVVLYKNYMSSNTLTMDSKSALPLVWILEILARSKQVPVSVLIDLSSKIPKASDSVFSNLRELVSLRILDSIHAQKPCGTSVSPASIIKSRIDPSERCVDVLQHIMKISASNLKAAATEMSKWDIQPFLEHKRSSFPNCFLVKMKDAIHTGNPPHLATLREQSSLPVGNEPEPRAILDGGDCNNVSIGPNMSDLITQIPSEKDHLISSVPTNSKYQLPENIPAKRKIIAPTKIVEERPCKDPIIQEGNVEAIMKSAKKHKPGTIYSEKQIPHSITEPPLNKSNVESSQNYIAANANGNSEGFSGIEMTDKKQRLRQEQHQGQHEHEQTANVNMDELDQDIQIDVPNAEEAKKRESCIASDRHNYEMADIAKKKEAFLSGQESLVDSFSELMLCVKCSKGENVLVCSNSCALAIHESCMISGASFDKDGKFYCPFCAYSRALSEYKEVKTKVSAARNELMNFISSESRKQTDKQPMSPNHLNQVDGLPKRTGSICRGKLDCEKAGSSEGGLPGKGKEVGSTNGTPCSNSKHKQEKKRTRQVTHSPIIIRQRQTREQAILKSQTEKALHEISERSDELVEIRSKKGVSGPIETDLHCEKAGPSEGGLPGKGKEVGSTNGTPCTNSKHKQEKKRTRQVTRSPRIIRQRQTREQAILKSQTEKALHEISERSDKLVEIRSKKGVSGPTETDLHCENKSSRSANSANEEEISEHSSDNSYDPGASAENIVRVIKNPEKQCLLRAQKGRLRWTSEEENKLKEAMKVICDEEYTTIPWTKILEYGAGTFHESRTAMHLKDKWRNICKAANKQ